MGDALREAHEAGAHVLVKEAMANGRLAVRPPEAVREVAARHGVGPDAVALAAVLAQEWAGTVLLGAVSPAQLKSNLAAVTVSLGEEELAEVMGSAVPPERYWAERSALPWV
ncbi:aldo/keto reductase [Actinomadura keratinilytica]|uniref:aldo/keto reductase n=1 Tax=Actinomadura keratinilytica TaxID=547461 RepID=UPI0036201C76